MKPKYFTNLSHIAKLLWNHLDQNSIRKHVAPPWHCAMNVKDQHERKYMKSVRHEMLNQSTTVRQLLSDMSTISPESVRRLRTCV